MLLRFRRCFRCSPLHEEPFPFRNPFRGFYTIYRLDAASDIMPQLDIPFSSCTGNPSEALALLEISLSAFSACQLPEEALHRIDCFFEHFTALRHNLIVRFLYDWDGLGIQKEPADLTLIVDHIRQLAPLLKKHTNAIFIHQGLLIGSWGEMHCSRYANEQSLSILFHEMLQAVGENTFLAVRCPNIWRIVNHSYHPLSAKDAFLPSPKARTGLFNDAIMGSETDMGTYGNSSRSVSTSLQDKYLRSDELLFQNKLCSYVPNGGEVIHPSSLNTFNNAIDTLKQMHVSYLNSGYDPLVLEQWQNGIVHERRSPWSGHSQLDYINAHLGYRYLLQRVDVTFDKANSHLLHVHLTILNTGFAICYRQADVAICVEDCGQLQEYRIETDVRHWQPNIPVELNCFIPRPEKNPKIERRIGLVLRFPNTGDEIRLANTPPPDGRITNLLGGLRV